MFERSRRPAAVATLTAALLLGLLAGPAPVAAEPTADGRPPRDLRLIEVLNVSHRGEVRGTTQPPENTLAAIDEAIRVGADAVEVDVTLTADDQLVLMHDRTLNRTTDAVEVFGAGSHATVDRTLAELRTLSAGTFAGEVQRIPTLAEVLDRIRGRTGLLIDVKYDHAATPIEPLIAAELLAQPGFAEWGPDTVSFGSYGWTSLQAARELLPGLELTFIMNFLCVTPDGVIVAGDLPPARAEGIPGVTPGVTTIDQFTQLLVDGGIDTVGIFALSTFKGTTASCADNDFGPADVNRFADAGILFAQEAQTPATMQDRIDRGVRAILTDYPDTLATVLPAPGAPTEVHALAGDGSAVVSWTAPDPFRGSRRTGHLVTADPGGVTVEVGPSATSAEVTGLANGVEHTFTVQAVNFAGPGEVSAPSDPVIPVDGRSDAERYVDATYRRLLERAPDPAGRAHWLAFLAGGGSRRAFVQRLTYSAEATRGATLDRMFRTALDRPADPSARAYWGDRLLAGTRHDRILVSLLASPELHAASGGTDEAWVDRLYRNVLGRPVDPQGAEYHRDRLAAGRSRSAVAADIVSSMEAATRRVVQLYEVVLGRAPDRVGLAHHRDLLRRSGDPRPVLVSLAASTEASVGA